MTEVLRGDSGYAQLHPGQVDPGVLPQPAAVQDGADDLLAHDLLYLQGDLSVLEEGAVAGTDVAGQRRVAIGDDRLTGAGGGRGWGRERSNSPAPCRPISPARSRSSASVRACSSCVP